jgi:hypothetical protein
MLFLSLESQFLQQLSFTSLCLSVLILNYLTFPIIYSSSSLFFICLTKFSCHIDFHICLLFKKFKFNNTNDTNIEGRLTVVFFYPDLGTYFRLQLVFYLFPFKEVKKKLPLFTFCEDTSSIF